jgi:hypothetical protein
MRTRRYRWPSRRALAAVVAAGLSVGVSACGGVAAATPASALTQVAGTPPDRVPAAPPARAVTASPARAAAAPPARTAAAPKFFRTLPPGARLPSGAQCARWVRARPVKEDKGVNKPFNRRTGAHVAASFLAGDNPQADRELVPRINGEFTGTTAEILRWAACKWGINQDIVFAQAAVESWWRQTTKGDWETGGCPPGHGPGVDGKPGLCPQSWGILQNRYPYETSSWPGIERSTAMSADVAYAIWRSCYDGYETWLNTVTHVGTYRAGDVWGCVGRWSAGRWHTPAAQQYIAKVKLYLRERIWTNPDFQQP